MEYSEQTQKRLLDLDALLKTGHGILTRHELFQIKNKVLESARGSGGREPPGSLDILCISAPSSDLQACQSPGYITLRCVHGNEVTRSVRCRVCDGCKHAWRSKVRALILKGCEAQKSYMLTLTIPEFPAKLDQIGGVYDVAQNRWHNLLRIASKDKLLFQYLRVVELQKRGTPHFHCALNRVTLNGEPVSSTAQIYEYFVRLAKMVGFGHRPGKTISLEAARLDGAGVASYMSKYLEKSEGYNDLRRPNGRAIRRYCRSRGWVPPKEPTAWKFAKTPDPFTRTYKAEGVLPCSCGDGFILRRDHQAEKWLRACRAEDAWVAPLGVADYFIQKRR